VVPSLEFDKTLREIHHARLRAALYNSSLCATWLRLESQTWMQSATLLTLGRKMQLKLAEFKRHAKQYVEIEAHTKVLKIKFVKRHQLTGTNGGHPFNLPVDLDVVDNQHAQPNLTSGCPGLEKILECGSTRSWEYR